MHRNQLRGKKIFDVGFEGACKVWNFMVGDRSNATFNLGKGASSQIEAQNLTLYGNLLLSKTFVSPNLANV